MCDDRDLPTTARFASENNVACCTSIIVAERNTNEFVQVKAKTPEPAKHFVMASAIFDVTRRPSLVSTISQVSPSPPIAVDIPIFTSSLLI